MRKLLCWVGLGLLGSLPALAQAELYRYVDDRGTTVLDSRVPAEFVSRGYEVLDAQGRVKQVIPAAPTREEREATRRARADQERQRASDATLLRLYSSPTDLDRAHQRQITQIENLITTTEGNIAALRDQRDELQARAAAQERAGRQVDPQLISELSGVDAEVLRLQRMIASKRDEIIDVNQAFARQRDRLVALIGDLQPQ
ncbi:protein of unknown function [Halopseudomonas xinjiangensis]|uniref:Uncharacterized protein n=1 Tax=Halopseudomonas xinjiangensis TaxID=487184 RepID=A0A1H1XF23_9GAMM|nr:DUF4124 domain-containing protein [Halopseudomonas xinjiangensis]SDT07752.1 protein of unknown function [Halopseudomonas xinjiangensis]